jgi:hypothetical protein
MSPQRQLVSLSFCFVGCALVTASVSRAQVAKIPQPLPFTQDVKTPAPPAIGGELPGLVSSPPLRPEGLAPAIASRVAHLPASARDADRRFEHVFVAEPGDGALWAHGKNWKASFSAAGAQFVPYFGAQAPANHPVRFTLDAARVGDKALRVDAHAAPAKTSGMTLHEPAIDFDRGAITERWLLGRESAEQTFVVFEPHAFGELVLHVAVETDLEPVIVGGTLAFANELGRVQYGAATAIDASGQAFELVTTWVDGAIELRLAASSVAKARFPLVVDPVVSTFAVLTWSLEDQLPDVAYDATSDSYIVVSEETYSGTDHDVIALQLDASGNVVNSGYVDYTTDYWAHPRVANNAIAGSDLCVAAVGQPTGGTRIIRGATVSPAALVGTQFTINGAESGDKLNPDVGGDPALAPPTYFMVVWERVFSSSDHDVHGRLVNANGTLAGTSTILVDNTGGTLDTQPAISKSDGHPPFTTQNWTVVWQRDYLGIHQQVFGAQLLWDGTLTHATFPIDATSDDVRNPRVSSLLDGDGVTRPYMVVMEGLPNFANAHWGIDGLMFVGTTFVTGTSVDNQSSIATFTRNHYQPCVDSDGWHFSVAFSEEIQTLPFYSYDIDVADLVFAGGYPYVSSSDRLSTTAVVAGDPSITSTYSANGARTRYCATWDSYDLLSPNGSVDILGSLWDGGQGGFTREFCFGDGSGTACPCGNAGASGNGCANSLNANGGNLTSTGNPWVSNDNFVLQASGLPNAAALYFQGTQYTNGQSGVVFGDGLRCAAGTVTRLGTKLNAGGVSQFPDVGDPSVSVRGMVQNTGGFYIYQVWYRNAASFCTASTFNLTNALYAIWGP